MTGLLIRGARLVDPVAGERMGDLRVAGDRIVAIADRLEPGPGETALEAQGLLVLPGAVDTHSHADARVLDDDVQLALLRQGVTTVIVGQDGVSFAPGDGGYASGYFGALNGELPRYRGPGVRELLAAYDGRTRLNVAYLVPAGTVRHEVMGGSALAADEQQMRSMVELVRSGLADGAVGLSSGLDYVPGCFADAEELARLCAPVAEAGGVYVTHMRGYEERSGIGMDEVERICERSGVAAHVSHFHARAELVEQLLEHAAVRGADMSFDAYPYFRGFTLLSMALLPKELIARGNEAAGGALRDDGRRAELLDGWAVRQAEREGEDWAERMRIAAAGAAEYAWAEGMTLAAAARSAESAVDEFAFRLLGASSLRTTVVIRIRSPRDDAQLARQFRHPGAMVGSDGIYLGGAPHPRAWGAFARMLGRFVRERGDLSWVEAAELLAHRPARRFQLAGRGRVAVGAVADLALVDPAAVADTAGYDAPRSLAEGIGTVIVRGRVALRDGELTGALTGGGLRRGIA